MTRFFLIPTCLVASMFAADAAAKGQQPAIPTEDGVYLAGPVADHAVPGSVELTLGGRDVWIEVGARVPPTRAVMTSLSAPNDHYQVRYSVPKGGGCTHYVLLRIDGTWRADRPSGFDSLTCTVSDQVDDTPKGLVARLAAILGATPIPWRVYGDRVTATFAPTKPVFQRGEDPEILFTMRNPADAPPVLHPLEPVATPVPGRWTFTVSRDGVDVPHNGPGGNGGVQFTLLAPGDSATTIFRPCDWGMDLSTAGHYVVRISKMVRFRPTSDTGRAGRGSSNPGGDQTFTGTVEFDVANTLVAGATTVRGRVTGDSASVSRVRIIWLGGVSDRTTSVGADGSFVFPIVRPGTYKIGTPDPVAPFQQIVVDSGRPLDVEIPVLSSVVHGRVTTTVGLPLAPFTLSISDGPLAMHPITLAIVPASDGTFKTTIPQGTWIVGRDTGLPPGERLTSLRYGSVDLFEPAVRPPGSRVRMSVTATTAAELAIEVGPIVPAPMTFVSVAPGTFMMGCSAGDTTCAPSERPAHEVRITRPFELGAYEVTRAQWKAVMSTLPAEFPNGTVPPAEQSDDRRPVESVSWTDAQEFLRRLNSLHDGYHYRLPTEAEWEYAGRAGDATSGRASAVETAWFRETSTGWTRPVGQKAPNAWGFYDMVGNVDELVQDFYGPFMAGTSQLDPTGPATGTAHVIRGGSIQREARTSSLSSRYATEPGAPAGLVGIRIVREPTK